MKSKTKKLLVGFVMLTLSLPLMFYAFSVATYVQSSIGTWPAAAVLLVMLVIGVFSMVKSLIILNDRDDEGDSPVQPIVDFFYSCALPFMKKWDQFEDWMDRDNSKN